MNGVNHSYVMPHLTRRRWLLEAAVFAGLPGILSAIEPDEELIEFADTQNFAADLKPAHPRMKLYDWRRLSAPITPTEEFFVFHQTSVPTIDLARWKLEIGGAVERPRALTLDELRRFPAREVEFTLECSGNLPRPEILNGQVGHARWAGVSLAAVLDHCGVRPEAREVVFFGLDQIADASGEIVRRHARSVFVQDAMHSDAMLATKMNGAPLTPEHGFPLRLILPGWYGMAQIKWLSRIEVLDRRYEGVHMSRNYQTVRNVTSAEGTSWVMETSISKTRLKSIVARVTRRRVAATRDFKIVGAAWGGGTPIARVELKIDDGPWVNTVFDHRGGLHGWTLWSFAWAGAVAGRHRLTSRAIDANGAVQPTAEVRRKEIRSAREDNSQWERVVVVPG